MRKDTMISKARSVRFFFFKSQLFKAAFTIAASMVLAEDKCETFFQVPRPKFGDGARSRVHTVLWH